MGFDDDRLGADDREILIRMSSYAIAACEAMINHTVYADADMNEIAKKNIAQFKAIVLKLTGERA